MADPGKQLFCSRLKQKRIAANLTQTTVAARLGRPQSFVAKYESGERRVDVVELLAIAGAIGFDPVEFLRDLCDAPGMGGAHPGSASDRDGDWKIRAGDREAGAD